MKYLLTTKAKYRDGTEQELRSETPNAMEVARFISGVADESPGVDITFTIRADRSDDA